MLVRWIITSGDRQLTQIEHAAKHVAVEGFDVAFTMKEIDGAARLLARASSTC